MRSKSHDLTKRKGLMVLYDSGAFTLIELVMVILLVGILSAVVMPKFVNLTGSANEATSEGVVGSLDEGLANQLSQNLAQGDLSSYVTVTGANKTSPGTVTFLGNAPIANNPEDNPYPNPFLTLTNYLMPTTLGTYGSGTMYNFGNPVTIGLTLVPGNSWWLNYAAGTAVGPGNVGTPVLYTPACDNSIATNPNFLQPNFYVPNNEYILPLGAVDYVYSNGTTVDSYSYYMEYSIKHDDIEGFYTVPCQSQS